MMLRQLNLALGKQARHSTLRRAFASSSSSSPGGAAAAKMGTDMRGNNAQHSILNQEDLLQTPRSTIMFQTVDEPGSLEHAIRLFWKNDINMTRIESKPSTKSTSKYDFIVDFEGTQDMEQAQNLIKDLRRTCVRVEMVDAKTVPWFPQSLSDLDYCVLGTLDAGAELESDHPGSTITSIGSVKEIATGYTRSRTGTRCPASTILTRRRGHVSSIRTRPSLSLFLLDLATCRPWLTYYSFQPRFFFQQCSMNDAFCLQSQIIKGGAVYDKLQSLFPVHACKEYLDILPQLEKHCGCRADNIPQVRDISEFLEETTGWRMRPVAGLLSARNFLNGLAFKTFFSTQYIRHHSMPLYTPEPDICHELMGHAPMFGDPKFAEFSHQIGLASLGKFSALRNILGVIFPPR